MTVGKSFFRRIIKDLCHKELLPLKLIFFVKASTLFVLYPYLTIHKRELGINIEETAIMSSITPFVAIIMPPLAGLLADKIGNFKIMLAFFSSIGGAAALLLLLVPVGRINARYPHELLMDFGSSGPTNDMIFNLNENHHYCETDLKDEVTVTIRSCGYACFVNSTEDQNNNDNDDDNNEDDDYIRSILSSKIFSIEYLDQDLNHSYFFKYERPNGDYNEREMTRNELFEIRVFRSNEFYSTAIRQLSKNMLFFPAEEFYQFSCSELDSTENVNDNNNLTLCKFQEFLVPSRNKHPPINYSPFQVKLKVLPKSELDKEEKRQPLYVEALSLTTAEVFNNKSGVTQNGRIYNSVQCENTNSRTRKVSIIVPITNITDDNSELTDSSTAESIVTIDGCSERCIVTAKRNDLCSNKNIIIEYNPQLTFWLYLLIRVLIGIIGSTAFAMFEGAVIAILREHKADYGLQRIYGSLGGMISSPLSGLLIDYASQGKEYSDFRPAFYLYAALKIASGVLMLTINLEFKAPAHNVIKDFIGVLKNIEIAALMFACFMLGTVWGYLESFLFWLIQDLGGSNSLMGITITIGGITGIPLLAFSGPIINKIGHANVLFIGFVFYAVRLIGYSYIYNPWHSLIFESLESVTTSLSFTAAVTYAAKLSTQSTDTSIQGLLGSMYYGVGKGSGSLVGGFIMKNIGTRHTYRVFAGVSVFTGIVYFFFNACYLKKLPQVEGNEITEKEPKKKEINGVESSSIDAIEKKIKNNKYNLKGIENHGFANESNQSTANFKVIELDKKSGIEKINEELRKGMEMKKLKKEEELRALEDELRKANEEEMKIKRQIEELNSLRKSGELKESANDAKLLVNGQASSLELNAELELKNNSDSQEKLGKSKELKNDVESTCLEELNLQKSRKNGSTTKGNINSGDLNGSYENSTRNNDGMINLGFENETNSKCSVTVERETEDRK